MVGLLALAVQSTHAQRLAASWTHPFRPLAAHQATYGVVRSVRITLPPLPPQTHAIAGAVIGGLAFWFLGAVTGVGLCHFDAPCAHPAPFAIGGFALGVVGGVAIGFRIGDLFPSAGVRDRGAEWSIVVGASRPRGSDGRPRGYQPPASGQAGRLVPLWPSTSFVRNRCDSDTRSDVTPET
ncbi:MAG: hypothetical protein ACREJ3_02680 [Polyangiaceae bacterium]